MPSFPVINAMRTTMFYHLGSVAFGSFIIAIVQFVRVILEYINRKTQQIQQNNQVKAAAACCTTACTPHLYHAPPPQSNPQKTSNPPKPPPRMPLQSTSCAHTGACLRPAASPSPHSTC
jgi:hypothetical protein